MADDPLMEEYKLLLGKIDKVGDYRFTIRGWSATIVLGLLLGSSAADTPYIPLLALPVVLLFYVMEAHQNGIEVALMKRATSLERIMHTTSGKTYVDPNPYAERVGPVPGIATVLNQFGRRVTGFMRWALRSDPYFYWLQAALILIVFGVARFAPAKEKDTPQKIYNLNLATTPQASEQPNGKPKSQQSPAESPKPSEREGKAQETEGGDQSQ